MRGIVPAGCGRTQLIPEMSQLATDAYIADNQKLSAWPVTTCLAG